MVLSWLNRDWIFKWKGKNLWKMLVGGRSSTDRWECLLRETFGGLEATKCSLICETAGEFIRANFSHNSLNGMEPRNQFGLEYVVYLLHLQVSKTIMLPITVVFQLFRKRRICRPQQRSKLIDEVNLRDSV